MYGKLNGVVSPKEPVTMLSVALSAMLLSVLSPGQDPPVEAVSLLDADAIQSPVQLFGYQCELQSCQGVRIFDVSGHGLKLCESHAEGGEETIVCTGKCKYCVGSGSALVCIKKEYDTCEIGGSGSSNCGGLEENPCYYDCGAHGLDIPCWCSNSNGMPVGGTCMLKKCVEGRTGEQRAVGP